MSENPLNRLPTEMGGLDAGPIERVEHEYAPWEKRCHALANVLDMHKIVNTEEKRRGVEDLGSELVEQLTYYRRWIVAFANILFQKQILTPGLVQMVTVLQLNRLELKEMINQEIVKNPVLEESSEDAGKLVDGVHQLAHRHEARLPLHARPLHHVGDADGADAARGQDHVGGEDRADAHPDVSGQGGGDEGQEQVRRRAGAPQRGGEADHGVAEIEGHGDHGDADR